MTISPSSTGTPSVPYAMTGVILAGGAATRLHGAEKALLDVGGASMIGMLVDLFSSLFAETLVVTNHPFHYLAWDVSIATDVRPGKGGMSGLHAALLTAAHDHVFMSACDTPFLRREVVEAIVSRMEPRFDVVVAQGERGLEPLCAAYSRRCLAPVANLLDRDTLQLRRLFKSVPIRTVSPEALRRADPDGLSFLNVNTPADLEVVRRIADSPKKEDTCDPSRNS